ncbi:phage portal protein family protein [Amycolatopsis taiwanensis]|uniref:phage portal protein family protein n=1 Tax=Amycolatopsis taiwanensis TaxID=342230 RepID=UPI00048848B8|nr:hypothetical protein [Amycolatopsis taiwanensis]
MASESEARQLNQREKRALAGTAQSSPFDIYDRLFPDYRGGDVFTYSWENRRLKEMLGRSGKARSVEQVLTLPLRSAGAKLSGTGPAAELVRRNLMPKLPLLIGQMTGAVTYKKAFFELVWKLDGGQVVLDEVAWRPPASCEAGFDPKTGRPAGFRQMIAHPGGVTLSAEGQDTIPGYVRIPASRAFIYTHGMHREPVLGVSDLDVAFWCWETSQKLLFLWFQYLEKQSLPNTIVYGNDPDEADENAQTVADMKAGGAIGMQRPPDPTAKVFDILEASGQGADQFVQAVKYLDTMMVASVLAGFTELADSGTASRVGSYALSADQSEFFLASRQAVADEMAHAVNEYLIRPLVAYNFGTDVELPTVSIGPLSNRDTDRALDMLKAIVTAPQLNVPGSFVDELVKSTAAYLGLDEQTVHDEITAFAKERATAPPSGVPPEVGKIGTAVRAATHMVQSDHPGVPANSAPTPQPPAPRPVTVPTVTNPAPR